MSTINSSLPDNNSKPEPLSDIHRMTGLLGLRFAQFWAGCKTGPWQTASTVCHDRNFYSLLSGNVDFAVIVR
jgi:hypothetical protein